MTKRAPDWVATQWSEAQHATAGRRRPPHRLVEDLQQVSAGVLGTYVRCGGDKEWVRPFDAPGMSEATIPI